MLHIKNTNSDDYENSVIKASIMIGNVMECLMGTKQKIDFGYLSPQKEILHELMLLNYYYYTDILIHNSAFNLCSSTSLLNIFRLVDAVKIN